jgi:N-carbamoylputrescine amidase
MNNTKYLLILPSMKGESFKIGLIQTTAGPKVEDNLGRSEKLIRDAAKKGAQIVCLQELFSSPYFCTTQEEKNFEFAEELGGALLLRFSELARKLKLVLIVPFFEKRAPGIYHNSAAVIEADGSLLGVYRKMHIPDDPLYFEKYYFTPGDAGGPHGGFKVFDTSVAKVGVLICWDQWYPEAARITSLLGAEIIFYPTAIGWHPSEKKAYGKAQLEAWQCIQRSHAVANGVFVASVNRVGHESTPGTEGIEFFGRSFVSSPFGEFLAQASEDKQEVLLGECTRSLIEQTRRNWPFFRDRRIDAYRGVSSRFGRLLNDLEQSDE